MNFLRWAAGAVLLGAVSLSGAEGPADGYDLHEWGVFSAPRGLKWAQADLRAEWASFPKFFYRVWPEKNLPYRGPVRKPVIFFHASKAQAVELTVKFATGRPLVWWPAAAMPTGRALADENLDELVFDLRLGDGQPGPGEKIEHPEVSNDHWVQTLREVGSTQVSTSGSHTRLGDHLDSDNFVYYDGVMKAPETPGIAADGDVWVIKTNSAYALHDVMLIERRGNALRVSKEWLARIAPDKQTTRCEMQAVAEADAAKTLARLGGELKVRLMSAGLNDAEAGALVKIWHEGLFKNQGLTLFYRVPQATYDAWLPLTAKPAPRNAARVGLVVHEHLEPDFAERTHALIKQLGKNSTDEQRSAAREALLAIGGAAFDLYDRYRKDADDRIWVECKKILETQDTRPAMGEQGKTPQKDDF